MGGSIGSTAAEPLAPVQSPLPTPRWDDDCFAVNAGADDGVCARVLSISPCKGGTHGARSDRCGRSFDRPNRPASRYARPNGASTYVFLLTDSPGDPSAHGARPNNMPARRQAVTVIFAARGDRWPAGIGRYGLLTLSISTSVI